MSEPSTKARRTRQPRMPQAVLMEAQRAGEMPLDYLLRLMRDESAAPARRDRAAVVAAQYCHGRVADTRQSQKQRAAKEAKEAGGAGSVWGADLHVDDGRRQQ